MWCENISDITDKNGGWGLADAAVLRKKASINRLRVSLANKT